MAILDDDTLVLAESHADRLTAWTITESGELVDRRVWADLGPGAAPDGICADAEGRSGTPASRSSGARGSPRAARCSQTIEVDRGCFACMLGGDDGRTLYIVANRYGGGSNASGGVVLTERVDVARAGRP